MPSNFVFFKLIDKSCIGFLDSFFGLINTLWIALTYQLFHLFILYDIMYRILPDTVIEPYFQMQLIFIKSAVNVGIYFDMCNILGEKTEIFFRYVTTVAVRKPSGRGRALPEKSVRRIGFQTAGAFLQTVGVLRDFLKCFSKNSDSFREDS